MRHSVVDLAFEQLTSNHDALDLVGALVELGDFEPKYDPTAWITSDDRDLHR